jgi:hypothetical protein
MKEASMRAAVAGIAVVVLIVVGFAVNAALISTPPADAPTAEANLLSVKSVSIDISEVQRNTKNLPVQKINDMTFVFSNGD